MTNSLNLTTDDPDLIAYCQNLETRTNETAHAEQLLAARMNCSKCKHYGHVKDDRFHSLRIENRSVCRQLGQKVNYNNVCVSFVKRVM